MKALVFGEVLWDIYPNSEHIGGAPLNFAAHFKKCGGDACIVTATGNDELGDKTVKEIEKMGICTDYITRLEKETGKCLVTLDENIVPTYNLLDYVAYDYIEISKKIESTDVLYFGTLALRHKHNRDVLSRIIAENQFKNVFVDINIRAPYYSEDVVKFACKQATILKISKEELPVVNNLLGIKSAETETSAKQISDCFDNIKIIIITLGENGSFVYDCNDKKCYFHEVSKVKVVSTVGAGDSFSAAFLGTYLKTGDIPKSLEIATKISGYVVSHKEAIPDYKLTDFIER